jgi:hypothetical protein
MVNKLLLTTATLFLTLHSVEASAIVPSAAPRVKECLAVNIDDPDPAVTLSGHIVKRAYLKLANIDPGARRPGGFY